MKKILALAAMLALTTSVFALEAVVLKTSGKVEVQKGNSWVALKVGDTVEKGSVISTGFKSEASLKIRDSVINVAPLTRLTVEQLVEKPGKDEARLYLATGSLKSNIKHTEDRRTGFTVRSPVATASVRGTVFEISTGFQTTNLFTADGSVAFFPTENPAPVLATEEEDKAPPVMPGKGNSASQVAPEAPKGSSAVGKGQKSTLNTQGKQTSPQANAEEKTQVKQPQTAASKEAQAAVPTTPQNPVQVTTVATEEAPASATFGSLTVNVTWE